MLRFSAFLFWMMAASPALAETITVDLAATDVVSHSAGTAMGDFYTVSLSLPSGLTAADVSSAVLELYVDVSAAAIDGWTNDTPLLEVYALSAAFTGTLDPEKFRTPSPMVRPVRIGVAQRVQINVTRLVKDILSETSSNHGLAIGSFRGAKEGRFTIRTDQLPNGASARIVIVRT